MLGAHLPPRNQPLNFYSRRFYSLSVLALYPLPSSVHAPRSLLFVSVRLRGLS